MGTATSAVAYCETSISVPFAVIEIEPSGTIYSEGIAATVIVPVVYLPLATAVCADWLGVTVFPACVESWEVVLVVPAVT